MYETSLCPYYQMLCSEQKQPIMSHPLRIEFIMSYLFKVINQRVDEACVKSLEEFRDNVNVIQYEERISQEGSEEFCPANISFIKLFQKISVKNVVQLLNCLLLQRKIIIISKNCFENAIIIESLLELMSPVMNKTVFMNISYLKQEMIDFIDSPVPYVIGLDEAIWNKVFMRKWAEISDDTVYYDIETEFLTPKLDLPNSPEPMTSMLIQSLNDVISKHHSLNERELKINVKQCVFNYLLLLINDFRPFKVNFKEYQDKDLSPQSADHVIGLNQIFKFQQYLDHQNPDNFEFYQTFIDTQLFNDFIERALRTNQDPSLNLFISCLDILSNAGSFSDVISHQQQYIDQVNAAYANNQVSYVFHDILDNYERALGNDKTAYLKKVALGSSTQGLFSFDLQYANINLLHEIHKQSYIRSLIKKPTASWKIKPSKKSENNLFKQSLVITQASLDSRNQSNPHKETQQQLSSVYFKKGPQKVSTPKGLPSEIKTMTNFLSEDDSKSTNSNGMKNSQEECKSETSSIKSFFKFTLEKIQNKLKSNKPELLNTKETVKTQSLLFDVSKVGGGGLCSLSAQRRVNEGLQLKASESFKLQTHQASLFSTAFGPKSELTYGRPKCYSETTASHIKGTGSSPYLPQGYHVDNKNIEARASAMSTSNKSFQESPKSMGQVFDTFDSGAKRKSDLIHSSHKSLVQPLLSAKSHDSFLRAATQKDIQTSAFSTHIANFGAKNQSQHQLSYPIVASGMVIIKDLQNNTKRIVKNININLDRDDDRHKKLKTKSHFSSQVPQQQISQSLSNSHLQLIVQTTPQTKTLNSSRSGGSTTIPQKSIIGTESPSDQMFSQALKSSEKKTKNPSFKIQSGSNSGGKPTTSRAKAISYNTQSTPSQESLPKKSQGVNASQQPQLTFKLQKPKNSMKMKRDNEIVKQQPTSQQSLRRNTDKQSQQNIRQDKLQVSVGPLAPNEPTHTSMQSSADAFSSNNLNLKIPYELQTDIEGQQNRMRSISYQLSQPDTQAQMKFKMQKQQSTKNLMPKNSPSNSAKSGQQSYHKSKTNKQSKLQSRITDQMLLIQPKSHLQTFNEYQTYEMQAKQIEDEEDQLSDSQAIDTPHMQMEAPHAGLIVQSMNAAIGYINQSIVRQDDAQS